MKLLKNHVVINHAIKIICLIIIANILNIQSSNYIYAPWRERYAKPKDTQEGCPFCNQCKENKDSKNYIIKRYKSCFVMLNLYPYTAGHLLIIPYKHVNSLSKLTKDERAEIIEVINTSEIVAKKVTMPDGFNIGLNLGRKETGTSIPGHLHVHLVPRYLGDASFLTTTANANIVTKDLDKLYIKYQEAFDNFEKFINN